MTSGPITSWQIDGETGDTVTDMCFWFSICHHHSPIFRFFLCLSQPCYGLNLWAKLAWPPSLLTLIVFRTWYDWQEIDEQEERSQHISIPIPFLSCHHNLAKCWVPLGKNGPTLTVASLSQFLSLLFQTAVALAFFWLVSSCLNIPFMISLNLPIPL